MGNKNLSRLEHRDKKISKPRSQKNKTTRLVGPALLVGGILLWQAFQQPVVRFELSKFKYERATAANIKGLTILKLDVPFLKQEHSLSCEIAALRQALAGQGVAVPENDLISLLAFDPTLKRNGIWGNPYTGFVGDIDGKMPQSGFGVFWDPIAKVGSNYVRTEVVRNLTPRQIAQMLQDGNPVVEWGFVGKGARLSWQTPAGERIDTVNGEHARTIYGFTGTVYDPVGFFVMDPRYGDQYWSTEDLMENWAPFGNSGIIVYKNPQYVKIANDNQVWEISKDGKTKFKIDHPDPSIPVVTVSQEKLDSFSEDIIQSITQ